MMGNSMCTKEECGCGGYNNEQYVQGRRGEGMMMDSM